MDDRRIPPAPVQRGLTLVELMLGITILCILAALAPPSFTALLANTRLSAVESDLIGLLVLTRSTAIAQNRRVTLCRSDNGLQCAGTAHQGVAQWQGGLIFVDQDQNGSVNNDETVFYVANFPSAATILWNRGDRLVYQPDGTALGGSNGTFRVRVPDSVREHHVILSLMGRVRSTRVTPEP
ncbi:GspH/FimT family pseudopilin [Marinobacterium marinum]|uniref:Type II secretion system protein H n=1 Tax=Marinobacterium marinum TaxID=2756129 RepID=A0A7W2A9U5_9GAMM|nr:GspH/FimT family pseudopilin [Marinobacterium marinum]MBA4501116.1 GspH/FimT family pseudopilin [Marinobacterium marinum]